MSFLLLNCVRYEAVPKAVSAHNVVSCLVNKSFYLGTYFKKAEFSALFDKF